MLVQDLLRIGGYMAPAGEEQGSGTENRGDDYVPPTDDADADLDADKDTQSDETEDEKAEREKAEKAKEKVIPKGRFDEAVGKERAKTEAAEKRAKELEAELKASRTEVDTKKLEESILDLEDQLDKALADNDPAEKKRIRAEIRAKSNELAEAKAEVRSRYAIAVAVEQVRYDGVVSALEASHPELNPDSDEFDEELTGNVAELRAAYEATGMASSAALKKAAALVLAAAPKKEEKKDEKKEEDGETPEAAAKRKEEAVKKALAARTKQPANAKDVGKASDKGGKGAGKIDISKLSDAEFDKLTPEELKAMRGDGV